MFSDGVSIRRHCLFSALIAVVSIAIAKQGIVNFVVRVTKSGDADFVPQAQRVAALR